VPAQDIPASGAPAPEARRADTLDSTKPLTNPHG
jgi:hypothetical protein